ncbi:hypothetical protein [Ammoniphilus sp. 3BR4]|uniref:hypothetical protein n=1 Tax=Ammoniphilus sp. 3BR4 TaxID=3158265 RepID=UPI003464F81C
MPTFKEAVRQKNKITNTLLKRRDVHAVGVGYADPLKPELGAAIYVYTDKNFPTVRKQNIRSTVLKSGGTAPIRFIGSGKFYAEGAHPLKKGGKITQTPINRWRPVPGGVSIGTLPPSTGTAGLIVVRNGQPFILSNNHVLINNNSPAFAETLQPGPADGGRTIVDRVARAFQFVPLIPNANNFQDSCIALPTSNALLNPRYLANNIGFLTTVPGHLLSYPVGTNVFKTGRTTGPVTGTVIDVNWTGDIRYTFGLFRFVNQTVIRGSRPISLPGDSGSVWLQAPGRFAVALNFATSEGGNLSIANPIARVMSTYNLRVAIPASTGKGFKVGSVKGAAPRGDYRYVQPMTAAERKRQRVVNVRKSK